MSKLKRIILLILITGTGVFLAIYLCSSPRPAKVKIGNLLPLNQDLMAVGNKMKNGMELAKDDLLEKYKGTLSIEMDYENACFERETVLAVQKFIHEGVAIIGGSFCLFGYIPILPMTEAHKILSFNTASNPDVVLNKRFAFSTNVEIKDQAIEIANFIYQTVGARRAVTMHLDTPFGHDYNKYFTRRFEELGGRTLFNFADTPDGKEYKNIVTKIKAAHPDVIMSAHFGVPLGLFFKEVRAAGILVPIVGTYETEDSGVLDAAGAAAEGVMFASSESANKTDAMERFEKRYIRRYGEAPDVLVTNSYDDIILGVEVYLKCHGDRECMAEKMHNIENYQGASGVITIKQSGSAAKPTIFKIIRNRTFIRFQRGG